MTYKLVVYLATALIEHRHEASRRLGLGIEQDHIRLVSPAEHSIGQEGRSARQFLRHDGQRRLDRITGPVHNRAPRRHADRDVAFDSDRRRLEAMTGQLHELAYQRVATINDAAYRGHGPVLVAQLHPNTRGRRSRIDHRDPAARTRPTVGERERSPRERAHRGGRLADQAATLLLGQRVHIEARPCGHIDAAQTRRGTQ